MKVLCAFLTCVNLEGPQSLSIWEPRRLSGAPHCVLSEAIGRFPPAVTFLPGHLSIGGSRALLSPLMQLALPGKVLSKKDRCADEVTVPQEAPPRVSGGQGQELRQEILGSQGCAQGSYRAL